MLEGSAHITSGDARGGIEDQDQFLQKLDDSNNEGNPQIPAQEVRPPAE